MRLARLTVLAALDLALLAAPLAVAAQQAAKVFKVGDLHPRIGSEERLAALREAGYVESKNLVVASRAPSPPISPSSCPPHSNWSST